ncbi:hypothetical protein FEM03_10185 [Phragmitibacter flavus]|uniref:Aminoglycoside phosphotransferase domain-containing protein n=1 Tax=Phragmitibacter flavus TaxID=2576071 RepID=A0A5R8KED4_9BACT|nr:phosphotransferase [Phragmitibacter flavus]TLD70674.1 hypothetical protein FEM03_10185 [Phragmitibacter flavus]
MPSSLDLPIRSATETALAHGINPDRCDILQNGNTLVLRLTETLVARVVQDKEGPRQGTAWFARENAIAHHLTTHGAPVIPLHPDLPPGPHQHLGYPINFWQYVTAINTPPAPQAIGSTLHHCHHILSTFPEPLPKLAIFTESLRILQTRNDFPSPTRQLLQSHLTTSLEILSTFPHQPLHGDAHMGNLMNTTIGLLWTDWEDTFSGPVEWDLASVIWNAQILDNDHPTVETILSAYRHAGGHIDPTALHHSLIARAAVMSAWYPILYPNPNPERKAKLQARIDWLQQLPASSS